VSQPLQDPYATDPWGRRPADERAGLPYHLILRGGWSGAWWRSLVGILAGIILMMLVLPFVVLVPFVAWYAATGQDVGSAVGRLVDVGDPSPATLAYLNVTLAALIPVTWLIVRLLHGLRPRWLSSVAPRLRWKYLVVCLGLSVVALLATVVVSALVPQDASASISGEPNPFTPTVRDFLLVVLLLTPLQAAAEEYAFRGYLLQAFGGLVRHPAFAVILSSLLFAVAHGLGQSFPVFVDRLAFGLVAATLVVLTGGLEAGIAMHVLNNWLAFGVTLAFGDMASALNPTGGSWWNLPVTLTQSLVYLALAWWVARRMGLATRTDPAVLAARETLV
jgi:membrane protease YdiL (CAAX protease family)